MKRILFAATLATMVVSAHAGEHSDLWFGDGVAWYQHPCGLRAFAKYGNDDSPAVRRAYYATLRDPAQCSKLFP